MDEPTNFLDLESVDSLISACNKYKGALLLVSHNRDFLRRCVTGYISIVPGKFQVFDNMKKAEQATYTFIAEMEEGKSVKGMVDLKKSGGTVADSQKVGYVAPSPTAEKKEKGVLTIGSSPASAAKTPTPTAAKPAAAAPNAVPQYAAKEKVLALWKDGKWYAAVIDKVLPANKYTVTYTQYGNQATVPQSQIKRK
jgi:ATPase subunit of ABC transporter with duplicated ATPase domains